MFARCYRISRKYSVQPLGSSEFSRSATSTTKSAFWKRTHKCAEITELVAGKQVVINGWMEPVRICGKNLIFAPIRDSSGTVQITVQSAHDNDNLFERLRDICVDTPVESVLAVKGHVQHRPVSDENSQMHTGKVEIVATDMQVINRARSDMPFHPNQKSGDNISDELRLKYRHIDLRRSELHRNIELRSDLVHFIRQFLQKNHFCDIETPLLFKSTSEGAREFLIPTRKQPGLFYALPQSPQQYKQILMGSGFDRYYQIAKCFRDEDLRSDRQPEFTQVDLEMAFVEQQDVMYLIETLMVSIWKEFKGITFCEPGFKRMTYHDAMAVYGSDKPDLRFGMPINHSYLNEKEVLEYFVIDHGASILTSKFMKRTLDELKMSKSCEYHKVTNENINDGHSFVLNKSKFSNQIQLLKMSDSLKDGDLIVVNKRDSFLSGGFTQMGRLRLHLAQHLLAKQHISVPKNSFEFLWVHMFPLFTPDDPHDPATAISSTHHPFTAPFSEDVELLESNLLKVRGQHYDIVLNGAEIGGGSIRIHDPTMQRRILRNILKLDDKETLAFNHLIGMLSDGCPPHGGIALGLDRLCCMLTGAQSLREVIAFPKSNSGADLLVESPSTVDPLRVKEYHIKSISI